MFVFVCLCQCAAFVILSPTCSAKLQTNFVFFSKMLNHTANQYANYMQCLQYCLHNLVELFYISVSFAQFRFVIDIIINWRRTVAIVYSQLREIIQLVTQGVPETLLRYTFGDSFSMW